MRITALLAALGVVVALAGQSHADEIDWAKVDAALGRTASVQGSVLPHSAPINEYEWANRELPRNACDNACAAVSV